MSFTKLPDTWLFERHSKEIIKGWVNQLRYFHFKRAWGGHANDGDEFQVAFRFADKQELLDRFNQLGTPLRSIPADATKPVMNKAYTATEYNAFPIDIKSFPDLQQPGHTRIAGHKVFAWVYNAYFRITVSGTKDGDLYNVTDADFAVCLALEKFFDRLGWQDSTDASLEQSACCVSRVTYPELYVE